MVWVKFIKHFWKSKVSFYNLELLPFSSSLLLLSEQICCEPLIWSWLAWGYLFFCVALNKNNKAKKKIDALSVFFSVCLFFQHHGQWLFPPRWSPGDLATFTSFFTPADRAGASQPCGIKWIFFFPVRRFPSVLSAVRLKHLFVNSWQFGMRHSFLSQPLSCWWCGCEVSSSGAGLASLGRSHSKDGNFSVWWMILRLLSLHVWVSWLRAWEDWWQIKYQTVRMNIECIDSVTFFSQRFHHRFL